MIRKKAEARGGLLRNRGGAVRLVWLWLMGFMAYFAWNWGAEQLLALAFGRLHSHAMNLAYADVLQAPFWATMVVGGYEPILSMVESTGTALIFCLLARAMHVKAEHARFDWKRMCLWAMLGLGAAVGGSLICVATDSMRLMLPLSEPKFAWPTLAALPVCFLSALAGEVFMMDYLYETARPRLKHLPCILLLVAVEFVAEGGWHLSWMGMVNVVLQILLCCLLHERYGLAAATGLWFGWSFGLSALMVNVSFGGSGGVWSLYNVSEPWLTGGSHGLFDGAIMSALLLGALGYLFWQSRRQRAKEG